MWQTLRLIAQHPQYRRLGLMFGINSLLFTFWVTRIPQIKQALDLSEQSLGLMLFFAPMGGLTAMFVANGITSRVGEGRSSIIAMFLALFLAPMPIWASSVYWLGPALYCMGFAGAVMNVAMNAGVALLERRDRVRIMIACHGGWSLGGLIGSSTSSLWVGLQWPVWLHWGILLLLVGGWGIGLAWPSLKKIRSEGPRGPALVWPQASVWGLALIGMLVMIAEGAAADWSGVYLTEVVMASPYFMGMGYASFTLLMTLGRFYGDTLTSRLGGLRVVRLGTLIGALGLLLVLWPTLPTALLGFGLMGLGYSCIVPVLFSEAGRVPGLAPAMGIAAVASAGYVGFLGGPVLIGFLAEQVGLAAGFGFLLLLTLVAFGLSPRAMR